MKLDPKRKAFNKKQRIKKRVSQQMFAEELYNRLQFVLTKPEK